VGGGTRLDEDLTRALFIGGGGETLSVDTLLEPLVEGRVGGLVLLPGREGRLTVTGRGFFLGTSRGVSAGPVAAVRHFLAGIGLSMVVGGGGGGSMVAAVLVRLRGVSGPWCVR